MLFYRLSGFVFERFNLSQGFFNSALSYLVRKQGSRKIRQIMCLIHDQKNPWKTWSEALEYRFSYARVKGVMIRSEEDVSARKNHFQGFMRTETSPGHELNRLFRRKDPCSTFESQLLCFFFSFDGIPIEFAVRSGGRLRVSLESSTFFKKVKIGKISPDFQWAHVLFAEKGDTAQIPRKCPQLFQINMQLASCPEAYHESVFSKLRQNGEQRSN